MIPVEHSCPLGHTCEEIRDGKISRCRWYTLVMGVNPQTNEEINRWDCAISWLPIMLVEINRGGRSQAAAIESFRNEVVERQDAIPLQLKLLG